MTQWKDITELNGKYEISDEGEIRVKGTQKELHGFLNKVTGYREVVLTHEEKEYYKLIHRLVAEEFVDNPNNLPQVKHIDGDKGNNCAANLVWVKCQGNKRKGVKRGSLNKIRRTDTDEIFRSISAAARSVGGTQPGLTYALSSNRKYKGVMFEIVTDEE